MATNPWTDDWRRAGAVRENDAQARIGEAVGLPSLVPESGTDGRVPDAAGGSYVDSARARLADWRAGKRAADAGLSGGPAVTQAQKSEPVAEIAPVAAPVAERDDALNPQTGLPRWATGFGLNREDGGGSGEAQVRTGGSEGFAGGLADFARGAARGVVAIPEMVGRTAEFAGRNVGGPEEDEPGAWLAALGEDAETAAPWLRESAEGASRESPLSLRGQAYESGQTVAQSLGPAAVGAGIGALAGGPVGAAIGAAVGFFGAIPLFAGSQGAETYERTYAHQVKQGLSQQDAHDEALKAGWINAGIEGGGELAANLVTAGAARLLPRGVKGGLVRALASNKGALLQAAKDVAFKVFPAELGTEIGQAVGQQYVESVYAGAEAPGVDTALNVVIPTMILAGLAGAGAHTVGGMRRAEVARVLADPDADLEQRAWAVGVVEAQLRAQEPELADVWRAYGKSAVAEGRPMVAEEDAFYRQWNADAAQLAEQGAAGDVGIQETERAAGLAEDGGGATEEGLEAVGIGGAAGIAPEAGDDAVLGSEAVVAPSAVAGAGAVEEAVGGDSAHQAAPTTQEEVGIPRIADVEWEDAPYQRTRRSNESGTSFVRELSLSRDGQWERDRIADADGRVRRDVIRPYNGGQGELGGLNPLDVNRRTGEVRPGVLDAGEQAEVGDDGRTGDGGGGLAAVPGREPGSGVGAEEGAERAGAEGAGTSRAGGDYGGGAALASGAEVQAAVGADEAGTGGKGSFAGVPVSNDEGDFSDDVRVWGSARLEGGPLYVVKRVGDTRDYAVEVYQDDGEGERKHLLTLKAGFTQEEAEAAAVAMAFGRKRELSAAEIEREKRQEGVSDAKQEQVPGAVDGGVQQPQGPGVGEGAGGGLPAVGGGAGVGGGGQAQGEASAGVSAAEVGAELERVRKRLLGMSDSAVRKVLKSAGLKQRGAPDEIRSRALSAWEAVETLKGYDSWGAVSDAVKAGEIAPARMARWIVDARPSERAGSASVAGMEMLLRTLGRVPDTYHLERLALRSGLKLDGSMVSHDQEVDDAGKGEAEEAAAGTAGTATGEGGGLAESGEPGGVRGGGEDVGESGGRAESGAGVAQREGAGEVGALRKGMRFERRWTNAKKKHPNSGERVVVEAVDGDSVRFRKTHYMNRKGVFRQASDSVSQVLDRAAFEKRYGGARAEIAAEAAPTADGGGRTEARPTGVDVAANEAATSPENALPEPSEEQKEAGNYKKGHVTLHGFEISIENPAGSRRRPEWPPLAHHYGYFKGTMGKDKDHIDVFLGPMAKSPREYFVVDQVDPKTGAFDEHKVMMGFVSRLAAKKAYRANYAKGWKGLGAVTAMRPDEFKGWLFDQERTKKPLAYAEPERPREKKAASAVTKEQQAEVVRAFPPAANLGDRGDRYKLEQRGIRKAKRYRQGDIRKRLVDAREALKRDIAMYEDLRARGVDAVDNQEVAESGSDPLDVLRTKLILKRNHITAGNSEVKALEAVVEPVGADAMPEQRIELWAAEQDRLADDWASRKYKGNKAIVEFEGDGPSKEPYKEIGAINEGQRRKRVNEYRKNAAMAREYLADKKTAGQRLSEYERIYDDVQGWPEEEWKRLKLTRREAVVEQLNRVLFDLPGFFGSGTPGAAVMDALEPLRKQGEQERSKKAAAEEVERKRWDALSKDEQEEETRKKDDDFLRSLGILEEGQKAEGQAEPAPAIPSHVRKALDALVAPIARLAKALDGVRRDNGVRYAAEWWGNHADEIAAAKGAVGRKIASIPDTEKRKAAQAYVDERLPALKQTSEEAGFFGRETDATLSGDSVALVAAKALRQEYEQEVVPSGDAKRLGAFKRKLRAAAKKTPADDDKATLLLDLLATRAFPEEAQSLVFGEAEKGSAAIAAEAAPTEEAPAEGAGAEREAGYGAGNKLVSAERAEEVRKRLKAKFAQLNAGIDPELLALGTELAAFHIEAGVREFAQFARTMAADLGQPMARLRPYLRGWYSGARNMIEDTGGDVAGMDGETAMRRKLDAVMREGAQKAAPSGVEGATVTVEGGQSPAEQEDMSNAEREPGSDLGAPGGRGAAEGVAGAGRAPDGEGVSGAGESGGARGDERGGEGSSAAGAGRDGGARGNDGKGVRGGRRAGDRGDTPGAAGGVSGGRGSVAGGKALAPQVRLDEAGPAPNASIDEKGRESEARGEESGENFNLRDVDLGAGGPITKARTNLAALKVVKQLQRERRRPTAEEQAAVARYVGFGDMRIRQQLFPVGRAPKGTWAEIHGELETLLTAEELEEVKASTQYAHYTSKEVVEAVWAGVERMGATRGIAFEAGVGSGNFPGLMPEGLQLRYQGVEREPVAAGVAQALYPQHGIMQADFAAVGLPQDHFDVVVGNPPFSSNVVRRDKKYAALGFSLHNYFIAKQVDALRPGGVGAFIVSHYFMDAKGVEAREYIARKADLVGAIRLPNTAFKANAGTEVVTDILFFRRRQEDVKITRRGKKRVRRGEAPGDKTWIGTEDMSIDGEAVTINAYFAAQGQMVLGEHSLSGSMTAQDKEYTVTAREGQGSGAGLARALQDAVGRLPADVYSWNVEPDVAARLARYELDPKEREGAFYLRADGAVWAVDDGVGRPVSGQVAGKARKYLPLKAAVMKVFRAQLVDEDSSAAQQEMMKTWRAFVKRYGPLNQEKTMVRKDGVEVTYTRNESALSRDPEYARVAAIEKYDAVTDTVEPGPIFFEKVIAKEKEVKAESAEDALMISLNKQGVVDLDFMRTLYPVNAGQMEDELGEAVLRDPVTGDLVPRDQYLSGNVRAKLAAAKLAVKEHPDLARNVEALEAAQPAQIGAGAIRYGLGAQWVPADVVQAFAVDAFEFSGQVSSWQAGGASGWGVAGKSENDTVYGTARVSAADVLDASLNQRRLVVKDPGAGKDDPPTTNKEETAAANQKIQDMKDGFDAWVKANPEYLDRLGEIFNNEMNVTVPWYPDGGHLSLPGFTSRYTPHPWQKNLAWRFIVNGNTYAAHAVGSGKTLATAITVMEARRLGLVKKVLVPVPKSTLSQWRNEWLDAYPNANILVISKDDLNVKGRRRFWAQAAMADWDAIIVTHDSMKRLGLTADTTERILRQDANELEAALAQMEDEEGQQGQNPTRTQIEAAKERIEDRIAAAQQQEVDAGVTFEELGADLIVVDEAHNHKKMGFATTQSDIKGVSGDHSDMGLDLYTKARYLREVNPRRSLLMLSGTPITNSIGEIYQIQRLMQPDVLERMNADSFDSWAATFAGVKTSLARTAGGDFKPDSRMIAVQNRAGLVKDLHTVLDIVDEQDLIDSGVVNLPAVKGGERQLALVPESEDYGRFQAVLNERLKAYERMTMRERKQPGAENIPWIMSDGAMGAIDLRLVQMESTSPSKVDVASERVAEIYHAHKEDGFTTDGEDDARPGGLQLVFSDLWQKRDVASGWSWSAAEHLVERLVALGVPREKILNVKSLGSDERKRKRAWRDANLGRYAVLIGGTQTLGTGVNVQKRAIALHHLDVPLRPDSIIQREGRIVRNGNQYARNDVPVEIYAWAKEGSIEAFNWQLNADKQAMIESALNKRDLTTMEIGGLDSDADQMALAMAMVTGDPRVLERAGMEADVRRLRALEQAFHSQQAIQVRQLRQMQEIVGDLRDVVPAWDAAAAKVRDTKGDRFSMSVGDANARVFSERAEAGKAFTGLLDSLGNTYQVWNSGRKVAEIGGLDVVLSTGSLDRSVSIAGLPKARRIGGPARRGEVRPDTEKPLGAIASLEAAVRRVKDVAQENHAELARAEKAVEKRERQAEEKMEFQYGEELRQKTERLRELDAELAPAQEEKGNADGRVDDDGARFALTTEDSWSAAKGRRGGLSATFVESLVRGWLRDWKGLEGFSVRAVAREDQLPSAVRETLLSRRKRAPGAYAKAVFVPGDARGHGELVFVAENFTDKKDVLRTTLHEAGLHVGLRQMMGPALDPLLDVVAADHADGVALVAKDYGYDMARTEQRRAAAEEYLANLAETHEDMPLLKRVYAAIRRWLRERGLRLRLSNADLDYILTASRRTAKEGVGPRGRGRAALAMRRAYGGPSAMYRPAQREMFVGAKAFVGDERLKELKQYALGGAMRRIEDGEDAEAVRRETGWFKGVDGKWRFEIEDSGAKLIPKGVQLLRKGKKRSAFVAEVLEHPTLFAAYPEVGEITVRIEKDRAAGTAQYDGARRAIALSGKSSDADLLGELLHEIQHGIQHVEGFAKGGSPTQFEVAERIDSGSREAAVQRVREAQRSVMPPQYDGDYAWMVDDLYDQALDETITYDEAKARIDAVDKKLAELEERDPFFRNDMTRARMTVLSAGERYNRLAGEVEARNVQARLGLSAAQRVERLVESTEDVPRDEQIVMMNGQEMSSAPPPANGAFAAARAWRKSVDAFVEKNDGRAFSAPSAVGGGRVVVTESAKQPGRWQMTYFDKDGVPQYDSQERSYRAAVEYMARDWRADLGEAEFADAGDGQGVRFALADGTSMDSIGKRVRELQKGIGREVDALQKDPGKALERNLMRGLGALTLRMLTEKAKKVLNAAPMFDAGRVRYETERNKMAGEAQEVAQGWVSHPRTEADALADVMHESTTEAVDASLDDFVPLVPDVEKAKKRIATLDRLMRETPGEGGGKRHKVWREEIRETKAKMAADKKRRAAYRGLRLRFQQLPDWAQAMYRQARDDYKEMSERMQRAVIDRIRRALLADERAMMGRVLDNRALDPDVRRELSEQIAKGVIRVDFAPNGAVEVSLDQAFVHRLRGSGLPPVQQKAILSLAGKGMETKKGMIARVRAEFESGRVAGVYFPLQRFGDFYASIEKMERDANGNPLFDETGEPAAERAFVMAESERELDRQLEDLGEEGWTLVKRGVKASDLLRDLDGASEGFVAEVVDALGQADQHAAADVVYQQFLESLPFLSARKHFIHRKKTPGFHQDAARVYANNMAHLASQIARMEAQPELSASLEMMEGEISAAQKAMDATGGDATRMEQFKNEYERRYQWIMSPDNSPLAQGMTALGFAWYLGLTPAAALVNLSQTAIVAFPELGAKFGARKAAKALTKAGQDVIGARRRWKDRRDYGAWKTLTDDEREAMAAWVDKGALDVTQTHALMGLAESGSYNYSPKRAKAMELIGLSFHEAEVINRESTLLAGYRLGRAAGKNHDLAVKEAAEHSDNAHFDYSNANRARFMHSNLARVALMFKSYSLHMTWYLANNAWDAVKGESEEVKREAFKRVIGVLGMTSLFAGSMGLPTVMQELLFGVAEAVFCGGDDEHCDGETAWRDFLADFGLVGKVIDRGVVNAVTGADVSARVGLDNLWLRTSGRDLEGRDAYHELLELAVGPLGGIVNNALFRSREEFAEGNIARGVELMMPKVVGDALKAMRYASEGVMSRKGDAVVESLSPYEVALKAVGFNPDKVAAQYAANSAAKKYEGRIKKDRRRLLTRYGMAVLDGDAAGKRAALREIRAYNRRVPRYAIDAATLRQSLKSRARYRRTADSGVHLTPKLGYLREETRVPQ